MHEYAHARGKGKAGNNEHERWFSLSIYIYIYISLSFSFALSLSLVFPFGFCFCVHVCLFQLFMFGLSLCSPPFPLSLSFSLSLFFRISCCSFCRSHIYLRLSCLPSHPIISLHIFYLKICHFVHLFIQYHMFHPYLLTFFVSCFPMYLSLAPLQQPFLGLSFSCSCFSPIVLSFFIYIYML